MQKVLCTHISSVQTPVGRTPAAAGTEEKMEEQEPAGYQAGRTETETPAIDLGAHVTDLGIAVTRGISDILAPYGLFPVDFSLLRACQRMGECTATQLAEVVPTDPSRISRVVTKLVDLGLLIRRRLQDDRRMVMLRLTDEGTDLTSQLYGHTQAYYAALMEGIAAEDLRAFTSTTSRIKENYHRLEEAG